MQLSTEEYDRLCATGFANGDLWESEREIREYFTVENFDNMFPNDHNYDQDELDDFADYVIDNRLHCAVTYVISDGNSTVTVNDFEDCFTIVDDWYNYLQEEHENLCWYFYYSAKTVEELNNDIQAMEEEIAQQLGYKDFQGHGNYGCNAASQMGLNLTVTVKFPKD